MLRGVVHFSPWQVLTSTRRGLKETVKAQMAQVSFKWALGDCRDRHHFGNVHRKGIRKAAKP